MALLALQFGFQPILNREHVTVDVNRTVLVFVTEASKLFLAFFMLLLENATDCFKGWRLIESLHGAALPAAIYSVQNLLLQQAYPNLDFITFNLLNQSKLLSTALFVYFLMGQKQSPMQCLALVMLMAGAALISGDSAQQKDGKASENKFWEGVVPLMLASVLSGIAAALSQLALQGRRRNSYLYTMELASYSMICLAVATAFGAGNGSDSARIAELGLFHGWTAGTLIPIVVSALGGIFVGQVTKYAGGVRKGFAIVLGILLTAFLQLLVYGQPMPMATLLAVPLIGASITLHGISPPTPAKSS